MGEIWVREFTGGLDTRRMPETTPGGVLIQATDGHITRGGEFEKRAALVSQYALPANTIGLGYTRLGLVVFGSAVAPALPAGVSYQRLQHPDGVSTLIDVPSFDLYKGKIYAVGVFSDGSRQHFYDGVRVADWFDGRARVTFRVTAGGVQDPIAATGSITITGGTLGGGNQITNVKVDGVTITSGATAHTGSNATTADAVAADINATTSTPDYTAVSVGAEIVITAVTTGAAVNGFVVSATVGGDATVGSAVPMAGGDDGGASTLTNITVDGQTVIFDTVEWADSNADTAQAVADLINASATDPEYTAIANGDQVVMLAADPGTAANGKVVAITVDNGFGITPATGLTMAGGAEEADTFEPGTFVRTIGSKMYSTSGPNMHFSGIQEPTGWTTDNVGAGFIDMSSQASGSEELKALAKYQSSVAVFAETNIQIWYVDPDPSLNTQSQVLNNTGTASPQSVTQFGDNDLFYLNESGLRSLRARDASNSAATTDIGVPIDTLVIEQLASLTTDERGKVFGLIEPRDGRFWLCMKDKIFVFSFFSGAKVSAWSVYNPGFDVQNAVVFGRRVYLRSGNTIYVYGGLGNALEYDDTEAVAQIPYLDGDKPWLPKTFAGFDMAAKGTWKVYVAMAPNNLEAQDAIGVFSNVIADSTFGGGKIPGDGESTHFSVIFKSRNDGYAKLGSCVVHYTSSEDKQT